MILAYIWLTARMGRVTSSVACLDVLYFSTFQKGMIFEKKKRRK